MIEISTDKSRLDIDTIHRYLSEEAYWSRGISRELVERAIEHSLCFAAYDDGRQVAFARVVTDYATFGYLADVFVLPSHRGSGVGKMLMRAVMKHPELQRLRRWMLVTRDAHGLYRQFGWNDVAAPERMMEIVVKNPY